MYWVIRCLFSSNTNTDEQWNLLSLDVVYVADYNTYGGLVVSSGNTTDGTRFFF